MDGCGGEGGRGVPDMPSPMFRAQVDCMACHKQRKNASDAAEIVGQVYLAVQDSCDACHATKYDGRLAEIRCPALVMHGTARPRRRIDAPARCRAGGGTGDGPGPAGPDHRRRQAASLAAMVATCRPW